jgi:L-amino acid N-acyltransferase YncA
VSTAAVSTRTWAWPADVSAHAADLVAMLAASTADDGILGYAQVLTERQGESFVKGLAAMVAEGSGYLLLGSDAQGVFGMCVVKTSSMPNCRHIADVSKAYLAPRLRGTPAVLELAAAVCARSAAAGVEVLTIDVREGTKAHRVWTHLGFTTYGILDDYSRIGEQSFRGHYMRHSVAELGATLATRLGARHDRGID